MSRLTLVFAALLVLTAATIAISFLPLGGWHTAVGVAIGAVKAGVVAVVFMELLHGDRSRLLAVAAGAFWLLLLIGLTMADYLTRRWMSF